MIHVVVGIITNAVGEILIAKRHPESYGGGLWEFPGGKLEPNEDVFIGLQREFLEEVGIQVITAEPWLQIEHDYKDRIVLLDTWLIKNYLGEPHGAEGQPIRWVKPADFQHYQFPAGNTEIINKLVSTVKDK